ncbi:MAG: hypothetical protein JOZ24_12340 [Candidatus Eremiobacteraeota bacterium]|nr:hypothetical protein [Candidatus Eremiobacteraeota bacterium]
MILGRRALAALAASGVLLDPVGARAADPVVTAFVAKTAEIAAGATATFQVGVTDTDAAPWTAASVTVVVDLLGADGSVVASANAAAPEDVLPNHTTFAFVDLAIPAQLSGTYTARATVRHDTAVVGTSDPLAVALGTLVAQPSTPNATAPYSGQFASNDVLGAQTAQSGTLSFTGKYGGDKSFTTSFGLSTTPGQQKPLVTLQTQGSVTQVGTFAPAFDPLVFTGVTGSGLSFKRAWGENHWLSLATISGAQATPNPFTMDAIAYAIPFLGGSLGFTLGDERVQGDIPAGVPFFMRFGTLAGLVYVRPADSRGRSFGFRYGLINYFDEISGVQRTDRAFEATLGFAIRRSSWTLDFVRAGPYFPNLSAPGVTPDRESESLQGTIPVGALSFTLGISGYRDALAGSPAQQNTHFYTENVGISAPLRNGDSISLNLTNAIQHRYAIESLASGNDNTALTYTAKRGATTYAFSIGSANQRDSTGNLQHTIQDGVTVTRQFGQFFQLSAGANFTGNHASSPNSTSLLQAFTTTASYTRGAFTISSSVNRSNTIPYLGIMGPPNTAINYGLTLKPRGSPASISATVTQNHSAGPSSSTGSLNFSRQI